MMKMHGTWRNLWMILASIRIARHIYRLIIPNSPATLGKIPEQSFYNKNLGFQIFNLFSPKHPCNNYNPCSWVFLGKCRVSHEFWHCFREKMFWGASQSVYL